MNNSLKNSITKLHLKKTDIDKNTLSSIDFPKLKHLVLTNNSYIKPLFNNSTFNNLSKLKVLTIDSKFLYAMSLYHICLEEAIDSEDLEQVKWDVFNNARIVIHRY